MAKSDWTEDIYIAGGGALFKMRRKDHSTFPSGELENQGTYCLECYTDASASYISGRRFLKKNWDTDMPTAIEFACRWLSDAPGGGAANFHPSLLLRVEGDDDDEYISYAYNTRGSNTFDHHLNFSAQAVSNYDYHQGAAIRNRFSAIQLETWNMYKMVAWVENMNIRIQVFIAFGAANADLAIPDWYKVADVVFWNGVIYPNFYLAGTAPQARIGLGGNSPPAITPAIGGIGFGIYCDGVQNDSMYLDRVKVYKVPRELIL